MRQKHGELAWEWRTALYKVFFFFFNKTKPGMNFTGKAWKTVLKTKSHSATKQSSTQANFTNILPVDEHTKCVLTDHIKPRWHSFNTICPSPSIPTLTMRLTCRPITHLLGSCVNWFLLRLTLVTAAFWAFSHMSRGTSSLFWPLVKLVKKANGG